MSSPQPALERATPPNSNPGNLEDGWTLQSRREDWNDRDETELVDMARAGCVNAFDRIIQMHYAACLRRAMYMLESRSDAEDEVQNACWKAFQCLEQFRGDGTFRAWLMRIVENECLMRLRQRRNVHYLHLDESVEQNVKLELVSQLSDPEDQLGWDEVVSLVRKEISRIPPLLRQVMLLRDLEQLSMPDVAMRLGVSVPAAKSRLMRARVELRARLAKHCGTKGQGTLTHRSQPPQSAYART